MTRDVVPFDTPAGRRRRREEELWRSLARCQRRRHLRRTIMYGVWGVWIALVILWWF